MKKNALQNIVTALLIEFFGSGTANLVSDRLTSTCDHGALLLVLGRASAATAEFVVVEREKRDEAEAQLLEERSRRQDAEAARGALGQRLHDALIAKDAKDTELAEIRSNAATVFWRAGEGLKTRWGNLKADSIHAAQRQQADARSLVEIGPFEADAITLLSEHPEESYEIVSLGSDRWVLRIKDHGNFWRYERTATIDLDM